VRRRAHAGVREVHLARILLRVLDQLRDRLIPSCGLAATTSGEASAWRPDAGSAPAAPDLGSSAGLTAIALGLAIRRCSHRAAPWRRSPRDARAGAGLVVDDDGWPSARDQRVADATPHVVGRAAGREAHHQLHRPLRPWCLRGDAPQSARASAGRRLDPEHGTGPSLMAITILPTCALASMCARAAGSWRRRTRGRPAAAAGPGAASGSISCRSGAAPSAFCARAGHLLRHAEQHQPLRMQRLQVDLRFSTPST
jgi:hypothetical protein